MLKRIMLAVCVGLFVAGVAGGCGKKKETVGDKAGKAIDKAADGIKEGADKIKEKVDE